MEIWARVAGFENHYEVSSLGKIRSIDRVDAAGRKRKGANKAFAVSCAGYALVCLSKDRKQRSYSLHRLIAIAFLPNPAKKLQVNHINGDKLDNRVENLEWATNQENAIHAIRSGLRVSPKGENCHNAKLTEFQVTCIRNIYSETHISRRDLAKDFGVTVSTISDIINRRSWREEGRERRKIS